NPSFADFHRQVRQTTLSAYAHQDLPFEMLVEKLQLDRDLSRNPLVQVMFSLQNTPNSEGSLSGLNIQSLPLPIDIKARFDLEVNFWETDRGLEGVWFYNTDLFNSSTINRIAQHFQTLLKAIVANPQQRISELPLLSPAERQQLLVEWNSNQVDYPSDKCIHQLFEEQVERNPDAVAIVFEDQELTYQELNSRANQLAHYLQYAGIKLEDKIGVFIERSPFMAIAILAILKAGGAYVPLDTAYPSARLALMIEDVQCPILITQDHLANRLPVNNNQLLINIDSQWESIAQYSLENLTSENLASENLATKVTRNNLAYIIYTSGSTGTPKGTEVLHRNVIGFMFGVDYVHLDPEQIWLQHSSISWDALTLEFWTPLLSGARCVLYPSDTTTPEELGKIIKAQNINILWLTSALFNLIIDTMSGSLLNVKQLIIGGEALSVDHVRRALTLLPDTQIINGYGPSECTVFTCCYPIPKQLDKNLASIPIGKPIGDRKVYLLDSNLQPVPIGVSGEIYVGGDSVARGYVNQLTLTREKFIPNHFVPGDTLYKTGDLARHLPDGNIEYLGRIDNQVKIRGFRIELGEVETALSQHKDIQVCYAIARVDTPGEKRLVAYVVPQKDITVTTSELRQFLGSKLPGYMIPSAFVILESLPLTANGKVDRRALKAPDNNSDSDRFIEARNQLELKLVQIWSKVLKVNKIGVQDNFFDLGGHSLLASYLMTQIQQQFDKDIPLTALFQNPTIEEFATILHKDSNESNSSCLVAIQPNGSNLPFFCVPGAGGRPFYFYNLGRYLGDEQPFYSFENDMYQDYGSITRIEDIANIYIQAMQAVQPEGPYFLGGHSYGGNVAFEMAQQLHKQGHSVGLLAIIDSSAPTYKDKQMLMDYIDWDHARWLAEVSKGIEVYLDKNVDISYETLQYLSIEEQLEYVLNYFKMANMLPPNAGTTQLTNIVQAYKTSCLCLVDYVPKQMYPGKITVLRANEDMPEDPNNELASEVSKDFSLGWSEFSTEPVDINFVLGNHITIMAEPHVQVLAEQLNVCIQKHR
ncbi:MAG: amino acid adenylation domain-containing protein, partial [Cyanobacteria bacterium P01_A01_bin.45]